MRVVLKGIHRVKMRLATGETRLYFYAWRGGPRINAEPGTVRHSPVILATTRGKPWTSDGFRTSWAKACVKAGITGLTFHDLRGSAVVRLALADATVPQIATFTGHSLRDVEAILDAHYLGRDVKLAEIAVMKLETRTKL
jgi:integrase